MGEVINLRRERKRLARSKDAAKAAHNRAAFGRTKDEKAASAKERKRAEAALDGACLASAGGKEARPVVDDPSKIH